MVRKLALQDADLGSQPGIPHGRPEPCQEEAHTYPEHLQGWPKTAHKSHASLLPQKLAYFSPYKMHTVSFLGEENQEKNLKQMVCEIVIN